MRPPERRETGEQDLFRSRLDAIIDMTHALVKLPGNPYDGHMLAEVIPAIEALAGNVLDRIFADGAYRGHNAPPDTSSRSSPQARSAASRRRSNDR